MNCAFHQVVFAPPRSGMSVMAALSSLEAFSGAGAGVVLGNNVNARIFAKSATLDPVAGFKLFPEGILGFLQDATGQRLSREQRGKARELGFACGQGATLRDLVDAWRTEPELEAFASAVARVMLPRGMDRG